MRQLRAFYVAVTLTTIAASASAQSTITADTPNVTATLGDNTTSAFRVLNSSTTELMRVQASGNVGIGTAPTTQRLTVGGNVQLSTGGYLYGDTVNQSLRLGSAYGSILSFDANTSISVGGNMMRFWTNPGDTMRVWNGNVGIGIGGPNPPTTLYVNTTASADGITVDGTTNPAITFRNAGSSPKAYIGMATTNGSYFTGALANDLILRSETNNILLGRGSLSPTLAIIGGNVGIGTTNPQRALDIFGNNTDVSMGILSGGAHFAAYSLGRTTGEAIMGIAGGDTQFATNALAGDMVLRSTVGSILVNAQNANGGISFSTGATDTVRMTIRNGGNVGIGATNPLYRLDVTGDGHYSGNLIVDGSLNAKFQDVAEWVPASESMTAGTVVIVSEDTENTVTPSAVAYDTRVAGVVSANPGLLLGVEGAAKARIATTGRVKVRVDADKAPIRKGDLLVTSDRSGIAMKSEPLDLGGVKIHRPGTLIGKALEPLASGQGEILVLLSLQ
jgi:hypothetical protein